MVLRMLLHKFCMENPVDQIVLVSEMIIKLFLFIPQTSQMSLTLILENGMVPSSSVFIDSANAFFVILESANVFPSIRQIQYIKLPRELQLKRKFLFGTDLEKWVKIRQILILWNIHLQIVQV